MFGMSILIENSYQKSVRKEDNKKKDMIIK